MARTITDQEIALMKAMIARGMTNTDIQFFFNRPGRPVNSGRISNIADGTYSNSASIPAATDEELNAFLDARSPSTDAPTLTIGAASGETNPVSHSVLRAMFAKDSAGNWCLHAGETDTVECKTSFSRRHAAPWLRAVAALANNRSGYVIFGVGDKDEAGVCKAVGLTGTDFRDADPGKVTERLQSAFQPTPGRRSKIIGVLHVERSPGPPKQRALCRQRLSSPDQAYSDAKGPSLAMRKKLEAGESVLPDSLKTARAAAQSCAGSWSASTSRSRAAQITLSRMSGVGRRQRGPVP